MKANDKNVSEAKFDLVKSLIEDYKLDWKKTGFINEGAFVHEFYNALLAVENLARDYSNAYNDTEYDHLFYCGNQLDHRPIGLAPQKVIEQERNDIWKWIGENSWTQDSPTGEVRVIDVDELADYWRKQKRETQSAKN